jgi:hypothetical protein
MLIALTIFTALVSLAVAFCVLLFLGRMIERALRRLVPDEESRDWIRFIKLATYVAALPRTIPFTDADMVRLRWWNSQAGELLMDTVPIKLYLIIGEALRQVFQVLGFFFIVVAVAYAIIRAIELNKSQASEPQERA